MRKVIKEQAGKGRGGRGDARKKENTVITLHNETYIFTSIYITNPCSK